MQQLKLLFIKNSTNTTVYHYIWHMVIFPSRKSLIQLEKLSPVLPPLVRPSRSLLGMWKDVPLKNQSLPQSFCGSSSATLGPETSVYKALSCKIHKWTDFLKQAESTTGLPFFFEISHFVPILFWIFTNISGQKLSVHIDSWDGNGLPIVWHEKFMTVFEVHYFAHIWSVSLR